ncbi:two-component system sensor histidine kinase RcsC [Pantoea sp. 1.19]|uniref:two-component system sensor histidine kinase RcsC n=1 Tax=Pantoea sp. 1.19 TaxID=1925589 RepID=UPI000948FE29|nr:two-component system sensor histidine kinase RcsC [Pantoea sp. 1.19]
MKYLVSFRTTLRISRYLFRALALMLWTLGALLTTFYIINVLHERESQVRQEFNASVDQAQWYVRHAADVTRELKFMAEKRLTGGADGAAVRTPVAPSATPPLTPLFDEADCTAMSHGWRSALASLNTFIRWWKNNVSAERAISRVFFIGGDSQCMTDFNLSGSVADRDSALSALHEHLLTFRNGSEEQRNRSQWWVVADNQPGSGSLTQLTPVWVAGKLAALLGVEQPLRLEAFLSASSLPVSVSLIDDDGNTLLSRGPAPWTDGLPDENPWFGYVDNYQQLVMKRQLAPTSLSVVYTLPTRVLLDQLKILILNALLLNLVSGVVLFSLAWLFERRMFLPAEENAHRLEEHEQFNRKIVASAPVGISILRTSDGSNILSNELAHNYLTLLSQEDRQRLTEIIGGQQVNFVDVLTGSNTNLQISFVHSRYRNENVAICVLVDVSARVKMEESLQEMAQAAEQASQSKSMFLATVSHELRTPLYGIIGNLDLLQTREMPPGVESLVTAMNNSSSLLLKIISDILDFSKIESEQLQIEPRAFSPREMLTHITANYLSLVVKKRLTLYCLIENAVPLSLEGDPMRLQQVISNLLNNAIKFTHTGCIILHARVKEGYLVFCVRDTGVGIPAKELTRLFDPFFQVGTGVQRNFQGTGLGLAICEKLITMMDGDIEVDSEPGMGSQFIVRIPMYNSQPLPPAQLEGLEQKRCWLALRNSALADFLRRLLQHHGLQVSPLAAGDRPEEDDIVIGDASWTPSTPVRAVIRFDGLHREAPQEQGGGLWLHSTATPHELPLLLGRIWRVAVDLPEMANALPSPSAVAQVDNDDITVLVVDDHPINRMLLSDQLGSLGYRVKTAQDGVDALNVLSRSAIDIVLSDVNMPNMDGYRLTQRLRQLGQTFPVIGVTANALAEEKQRCMEAGMDNCLSKPVTLDQLRQTLAFYAERVRKARPV